METVNHIARENDDKHVTADACNGICIPKGSEADTVAGLTFIPDVGNRGALEDGCNHTGHGVQYHIGHNGMIEVREALVALWKKYPEIENQERDFDEASNDLVENLS